MDFEAMQDIVRASLGRSTDYDTEIKTALNMGQRVLAEMEDWSDLQSTSDLTITVVEDWSYATLPSGTWRVEYMAIWRDPDEYEVELRNREYVREKVGTDAFAVDKYYAYREDTKIYILPDPESGDKLRTTLTTLPSDMSDDGDEPAILGSGPTLVAYALSFLFDMLEIVDKAQTWERRFYTRLSTLKRQIETPPAKSYKFGIPPIKMFRRYNRADDFVEDPTSL